MYNILPATSLRWLLPLHMQGDLSRNRSVGLRLGRGERLADITASMHGAVAEGVLTSRAAYELSKRLRVEVPIIEGIWRVIHGVGLCCGARVQCVSDGRRWMPVACQRNMHAGAC